MSYLTSRKPRYNKSTYVDDSKDMSVLIKPTKLNFFFLFILFLAALGLCCCTRTFSSCGDGGYSLLLHVGFLQLWQWGLLFVAAHGLLIAVASLVAEHGLQAHGLQQLWLTGSRAQAQKLWRMGLVAPRHVGSSRTRAPTHVPCIGRWILNHCTTREAPNKIKITLISNINLILNISQIT